MLTGLRRRHDPPKQILGHARIAVTLAIYANSGLPGLFPARWPDHRTFLRRVRGLPLVVSIDCWGPPGASRGTHVEDRSWAWLPVWLPTDQPVYLDSILRAWRAAARAVAAMRRCSPES